MSALVLAHHRISPTERLKDAAAVAFIALLLGIPMIGLTTIDQGGALRIATRWPALLAFIAACFVGRLLLRYGFDQLRARKLAREQAAAAVRDRNLAASPLLTWVGWGALGVSLALPIVFTDNRYVVDTATTVLIYVMLGWGLNVVVGLAGLLDLGYVAFYAVGAYTYGVLATQLGWTFWQALPVAGAMAASFGIILGWPTLRLRGDYLAIVTLGFGEIIRVILVNWTELSGGPNGITSIPRPSFFGLPFKPPGDDPTFASFFGLEYSPSHRIVFLYYLILALALLTNLFVSRMRKLPIGRAWEAMREDEIACKAMGINARNVKLSAFAIGAMLGGFAGVFFAARQGFISPESFTFNESAIILAIVVLGGMGSQLGVVLASLVLVLLPELGRDFAEYRMLLFGTAMILIMIWKPGGILAHREPTLRYLATTGDKR
ncbi:MAG: high-affinity branched-chain amino acid ABC transporter permease LivM [Candidatus Accumulibacter sp.]|jgi:branched-chain amino acid transport system permease protein|uniref:high-affinity branched-chain amino acid ABC transporter permease LivM n=1 Tax=Candidatus Accumulibacter TaxID=327159 RepID=UPI00208C9531|nr:high-affinity branched-chain amino acid ABC transporter permease LivM [Accumulibacter sp.]MBK8116317.1 high-affinity branched-chain amino acid ABC transporter permease LivM [Accumulibacter sp.]MBK8578846.1 high-affinity branched-chain amino acid ABC transporter permease LivM [Candidatus Accumulibacter propinquus]